MRTTVTIDDEILKKAERYFGEMKVSELIENGLKALIAGEAADRLAAMGGTDENAWVAPRRNAMRVAVEPLETDKSKNGCEPRMDTNNE